MGVFTHVRNKPAKRLSRKIRPYYQACMLGLVALLGMWTVLNTDPSAAIQSRVGQAPHPHSDQGRRRLEEETFTSAESDEQCRLDRVCSDFDEDRCDEELNCEWYIVLATCRHSSLICANDTTSKDRCDDWCPSYNWTYYNTSSGDSITEFEGEYNWTSLGSTCEEDGIVCNCSGEETLTHHNECENEVFGVPLHLRNDALHSIWILFIVIYGFIGIAIVCDTYFEPSLETISTKLKLSPDVAGATFMAMGSSAPELFTSLSDNFITKNNVGVGTIVGSALFNILVIVALSAFVARPPKSQPELTTGIKVDWRPVLRDVIFYSISIGLLVGFIIDESVYWWEALIMILMYIIYIIYMTQNPKIIAACDKNAAKHRNPAVAPLNAVAVTPVNVAANPKQAATTASDMPAGPETKSADKFKNRESSKTPEPVTKAETKDGKSEDKKEEGNVTKKEDEDPAKKEEGEGDDDDDDDDWRVWPTKEEWEAKNCGSKTWFIFVAPLNAIFWLTIPNCANPNPCLQSLYPLTFVNCVLWMAVLCGLETTLVTWLGCWWGISAPVMGIVILAIGTSVPDAIASMIVARGGQGDMAIANAVGSNVFDILFGLGLPWIIADLVFRTKDACGELVGIYVDVDGIVGAALILYGTVVFYIIVLLLVKWNLNKTVALIFFIMYLLIITILMLNEYCAGFTWKAYNDNC